MFFSLIPLLSGCSAKDAAVIYSASECRKRFAERPHAGLQHLTTDALFQIGGGQSSPAYSIISNSCPRRDKSRRGLRLHERNHAANLSRFRSAGASHQEDKGQYTVTGSAETSASKSARGGGRLLLNASTDAFRFS